MTITFEQLPQYVAQMNTKLENIERLLLASNQTPITEADQIMTIDEAAAMLNLKRQTVYGYVSKKQIPFSKTMGKLYFSKKDLQNWIKSGCKPVENKDAAVDMQLAKAVRKGK